MQAPPHVWIWEDLADALAEGLRTASAEVELEQAVRGLDSRSELELHPVLHDALRARGYGVTPEVRFPREQLKRRRSEGSRCDMVLTPGGKQLAEAASQLGLFDPRDTFPLEDAAWLEVKVVAQHHESGPHRTYAYALQHPVWKDVNKLAGDPAIRNAAVLLVLFTEDAAVAEHDLGVWASRASLRGLDILPRIVRTVVIGDRLGNRACTIALFPLVKRLDNF